MTRTQDLAAAEAKLSQAFATGAAPPESVMKLALVITKRHRRREALKLLANAINNVTGGKSSNKSQQVVQQRSRERHPQPPAPHLITSRRIKRRRNTLSTESDPHAISLRARGWTWDWTWDRLERGPMVGTGLGPGLGQSWAWGCWPSTRPWPVPRSNTEESRHLGRQWFEHIARTTPDDNNVSKTHEALVTFATWRQGIYPTPKPDGPPRSRSRRRRKTVQIKAPLIKARSAGYSHTVGVQIKLQCLANRRVTKRCLAKQRRTVICGARRRLHPGDQSVYRCGAHR